MTDRGARVLAFALGAAASSLLFIDVCNLIYGCGCRSLWAGAAEACNIHHASGPHCPWCAHPISGGAVAYGLTLGAQAAVAFGRFPLARWVRVVLTLLVFPAVLAVVGIAHGTFWRYWA